MTPFKSLYIVVILTGLPCVLFAQGEPSSAFENTVKLYKQEFSKPLGKSIVYLEDPVGELTIDRLQSSEFDGQWTKSEVSIPNYGFSKSTFWVKFKIHNDKQIDSPWYLEVSYPSLDYIRFYQYRNGELVQEGLAGDRLNFNLWSEQNRLPSFYGRTPSGVTDEIYLSIKTDGSMQIPLRIWDVQTYASRKSSEGYGFGILQGILLAMIAYNLFIYLVLRTKAYLYYILFGVFVTIFSMSLTGHTFQYLWPTNTLIANKIVPISAAGTSFLMLAFVWSFLDAKNYSKTLDSVFKWSTRVFGTISMLCFILPYSSAILLSTFGTIFSPFIVILGGIYAYYKGNKYARILVLAFFSVLVGTVAYSLKSFGILPTNFFTENIMRLSQGVQFILLSLALADKMKVEQALYNEKLKRFNQLKDDFLANTSHELRTPLNGIIGVVENIGRGNCGEVSETIKKELSMVNMAAKRLMKLVNDILDYSKLKNQKLTLNLDPLSLRSVVEPTVSLLTPIAREKSIELVNEVDASLPVVKADKDRMEQILLNLLGNAIKFTKGGQVAVSATVVGNMVRVDVTDTGIGIPESEISKIFDPFEQADGSARRNYTGTGLGLSVTKELVENHGGTISVVSKEGIGSTFSFTLPTTKDSPIDAGGEVASADLLVMHARSFSGQSESGETNLGLHKNEYTAENQNEIVDKLKNREGLSILVVDDEPLNIHLLKTQLEALNFKVDSYLNAKDALNHIEKNGPPDLLLLDVMMPNMSGYEMCEILREQFTATDLPVILLTAKSQVNDLVTGFASGANDYLVKPFAYEELNARINNHVNLKEMSKQLVLSQTEKARSAKDLEMAKAVQSTLLPEPIEFPNLKIASFYEPAKEVGGDWFTFHLDQQHKRIFFMLGDVTGHGLSSALVTGITCGAINASLEAILAGPYKESEHILEELFKICNLIILRTGAKVDRILTMGFVAIDLDCGRLSYLNAGHCPLAHISNGKVKRILSPGSRIGSAKDLVYNVKKVQLEKNDMILLHSDGLTENGSQDGEVIADRTIKNLLLNGENPFEVRDELKKVINATWSSGSSEDDTSFLIAQWTGETVKTKKSA